MRLYSYSNKVHTLVVSKWARVKFITGGIILGIVLFFGVVRLNQSVVHAFGVRSSDDLTFENEFLRQQAIRISYRASRLEIQTKELNESSSNFITYFHDRKIVLKKFQDSLLQSEGAFSLSSGKKDEQKAVVSLR